MSLFESLKNFNDNYANAVQAIILIFAGVVSRPFYELYKESRLRKGDAALIVKPVFNNIFGKKYRILAVHQYEKSNNPSGYEHISQNSRSDQWGKLIKIKSSYFGFRYRIIPINDDNILSVIISRNGKEKWRTMNFNH